MKTDSARREFLTNSAALFGGAILPSRPSQEPRSAQPPGRRPIKVVVWDERQPAQKQAYTNFLGNQIAEHLGGQADISVRSVGIDDPGQGLAGGVLDDCQVLIWWGHVRNGEIAPEIGQSIVRKIKEGKLSLIALHSAHWSTPFVEAMNERTRLDAVARLTAAAGDRVELSYVPPPQRYTLPKADARITPYVWWRKYPDGVAKAEVHLPYCCFPAYRGDGKPSAMRVLLPDHPIAEGIPSKFQIPQTEMYDEPFHVPDPDEVVLEERWASGEWFRSGAIWKLGRGRVFYFRPGHETFPVFKQQIPLKILLNAVRWLGSIAV
jgi:trehalose utilization protein